MNRTQTTLAGLLGLQILLVLLFRSPFASAHGPTEARPLLPELEAFSPSRIEILGDDDERVTLTKQGTGWALAELEGFPADATKIGDLVDDLSELRVRQPVVSSSRFHESLEIADGDNQGRVRMWNEGSDDPEVDIVLGSSPNYRVTHVRLAGADPVYEVRGLAAYNVRADAASWVEKTLVDVPREQVVGLTLTNEHGSFELAREEGGWRVVAPQGVAGALDATKVDSLVGSASSLRLIDAVGPTDEAAQGLDRPAVSLTVRWSSGDPEAPGADEVEVLVGGNLEEKETQRYITRRGFGFTGTIWESTLQTLLDQKLDDLKGS